MKINTLLNVMLLIFIGRTVSAQDIGKGIKVIPEKVIESYIEYAGEHAVIFNGKEEVTYDHASTNHPYLVTSQYTPGELLYNNILYKNVSLRYDLFRDELIIKVPNISYSVVLEKEKVTEAVVDKYRIIRHEKNLWPNIAPGNYLLLLHDGQFPVVRKNQMTRDQKVVDQSVEYRFRLRERYYIYKNGICHQVSNKGSLLKLFPDKKKELETYIKQQNLNFRKDREQSIVAIVQFYEGLTK